MIMDAANMENTIYDVVNNAYNTGQVVDGPSRCRTIA